MTKTIIEWGDALTNFDTSLKNKYCSADYWTIAISLLLKKSFNTLDINVLQSYESSTTFYKENKVIVDFLNSFKFEVGEFHIEGDIIYLPSKPHKNWKEEVFYCMKISNPIIGVPSSIVYILNIFKQGKYFLAELPRAIPSKFMERLITLENAIEVVSFIMGVDFIPLTSSRIFVPSSDAIEVYIMNVDRVALMHKDSISSSDMFNIEYKNKELYIGYTPLYKILGYKGMYFNSVYDLYHAK